ncbi:MAG TPA: glycosyltransferase family 4 protein [Vicinamibacterales bacterium]|jgi:glycosyltransferase involved in cell wall biosynthesis|nr:glycosyltransferase family 4 protein [Vicinamibacterales bacterium]
MRLLFVKRALAFPRSSGHDVHTFYMMKACGHLGHDIALATVVEPSVEAIEGLELAARFVIGGGANSAPFVLAGTRLQKRFRSFWGVHDGQVAALARAAASWRADAVVIGGLDALPYFPALSGVVRVWYAADEWVLHHCSQLKIGDPELKANLRDAVIKGLYERAHRQVIDRAWVVTESDRKAMRWIAGVRNVDVLPNGVDSDHFRPAEAPPKPNTAAFWGRLDFGPNIQALEWFCDRVWPHVLKDVPGGRFTIMGFNPGSEMRRLAAQPGIELRSNLPDLRSAAGEHALAVLPFVSGAGIKNKLLEAASMGLPIVCTPTATMGLNGRVPAVVASTPEAFASAIVRTWRDPNRAELGAAARAWVVEAHTWESAAQRAIDGLRPRRVSSKVGAVTPSHSVNTKS